MKCWKHKRYKGKGRPTGICPICWAVWVGTGGFEIKYEDIFLAHERAVRRRIKNETTTTKTRN